MKICTKIAYLCCLGSLIKGCATPLEHRQVIDRSKHINREESQSIQNTPELHLYQQDPRYAIAKLPAQAVDKPTGFNVDVRPPAQVFAAAKSIRALVTQKI